MWVFAFAQHYVSSVQRNMFLVRASSRLPLKSRPKIDVPTLRSVATGTEIPVNVKHFEHIHVPSILSLKTSALSYGAGIPEKVRAEFDQLRQRMQKLLLSVEVGDLVAKDPSSDARALPEVEEGTSSFRVNLDVRHFKPGEISVRWLSWSKSLVVQGEHEDRRDDHGYISRRFVRTYHMPRAIGDSIACFVSPEGILTIEAKQQSPDEAGPSTQMPLKDNRSAK